MMLDAVRAEAIKLRRHRATWLMVWIFPIAFAVIALAQLGRDLVQGVPVDPQALSATAWIQQSKAIWELPLQAGGRFIIAGFAALVFAGEYGWNTWKLVIPARTRWQLIAAKWVVSLLFLLFAFAGADAIGLMGSSLRAALGGPAIPAGVTAAAMLQAHAAAAANALLPIAYTIAFAGLFAVLTTSVLATVALSIGLIVLEQMLLLVGLALYGFVPSLTKLLLQVLPLYHMANVIAWTKGAGLTLPLGASANLVASWPISIAAVLGWIAIAGAVTVASFSRQDMN